MQAKKSIWYINKYASPPGANGGLRGLSLASEFIQHGHSAVVINSRSNHYVIQHEAPGRRFSPGFTYAEHWGVPTYTHQTIRYSTTASAQRILSWLHFEIGLLFLPARRLPRPTHIIVSSLSLLTVLNGYRLARKFRARLVFEIRDIWPLSLTARTSLSKNNPVIAILSLVEKFGYGKADVVVGTMPNLVERVHSVADRKIRVETIGQGIDRELSTIAEIPALPTSNPRFRVTYGGSIGRANALQTLLDVAESFAPHDGILFEFYGKGDYLSELQKKYEYHSTIKFPGPLPRVELFQTLRSSDVLIFATDNSEVWNYGQSLHKVVEYMAIGRPIIAAYSGFPSMINEADCGFFVPAEDKDALRQRIIDVKAMTIEERSAMGDRARKWILKHRTYKKLANDYLAILNRP